MSGAKIKEKEVGKNGRGVSDLMQWLSPPLSLNDVAHGDSLELTNKIPAKTVDLVIEDMPYNTTDCGWDTAIDLERYWETRKRILKPTGAIVLTAVQPFTTKLIASNMDMFKYDWVWHKSKSGSAFTAKYRPLAKHESVLVFANGKTKYNPQMEDGKPYKRQAKKRKTNNHNLGLTLRPEIKNNGERYPGTVQYFQQQWRRQDQKHPTQKPVGLFYYMIETYTNKGDLVFDGFGGCGTTAIAADKADRNYIVIEKDDEFYNVAKERLQNHKRQPTFL